MPHPETMSMSVARHPVLHEVCPLCRSAALRDLYSANSFTIARCPDCTLVFVRQRLTGADLKPYYEAEPHDYVYEDEANRANLNYYYERLKKLLEQHGKPGPLLDVGCCAGQFLDVLDGAWEPHGIEISERYATTARQKYGDRVFWGMLDAYPAGNTAGDAAFQAITLMDVLDHSPDPLTDLTQCNRLLAPGGLIAVKVHNISCLFARLTGKRFYAVIPPFHLFYFNEQTLRRALEATGFRVVDVRFIGHRMALKTIPYRLSQAGTNRFFHGIYRLLDATPLGNIPIYKNLHDIITVIGVKEKAM